MKTRNLTLSEFLIQLQLEYIVVELRRKIYTRIKDKKYYEKVMNYKAMKIKDISERNSLQSIFTNNEVKKKLYKKIYIDDNYPNFLYSGEADKRKHFENDRLNYYSEGAEVKFLLNNETIIGTLTEIDYVKEVADIISSNGIYPSISFKMFIRIL